MTSAQDFIALAASQIGNTGEKYNEWYWGENNGAAWCAAFQSWVSVNSGANIFTPSAAVSGVVAQLERIPDAEAGYGDFVAYNWDGRTDLSWMDHIGVVEWFDHTSDYFGTIEGNTGPTAGGEVLRMTRNNNGPYFTAFFRPKWEGGGGAPIPPRPTPAETSITLQAMSEKQGALPAVVNNEDDAGDGSPINYLSAWVDEGTLDVQAHSPSQKWLGVLKNPSDIFSGETGSAGDGGPMDGLSMYLWSPGNDKAVYYRVMVGGTYGKYDGLWLSWMKDNADTGGSGDSFAGILGGPPITRVEAYIDWA